MTNSWSMTVLYENLERKGTASGERRGDRKGSLDFSISLGLIRSFALKNLYFELTRLIALVTLLVSVAND